MSEYTHYAVYDCPIRAEAAVEELIQADVPASAIGRHTFAEPAQSRNGLFAPSSGGDPGFCSTLVKVTAPGGAFCRVSAILDKYDPIDIGERTPTYGAPIPAPGIAGLAPIAGGRGRMDGARLVDTVAGAWKR